MIYAGEENMKNLTMKEMPEDCQPYEKYVTYGPDALSDTELLAIIIRTGSHGKSSIDLASEILKLSGKEKGILGIHHLSMEELQQIKGIGKVKAIQIKCVAELSRRIRKTSARKKLQFTHPASIAAYYMEDFRHKECEELLAAFLDSKHYLIREIVISKGTVNESFAAPREIYIEALKSQAVSICLVHNHPSGDPSPSRADILSTKRLKEAGQLLGISMIDHIIIGDNRYTSFTEQNLL